MKVGDLVTCIYEEDVGIVLAHIGKRRYLVYWSDGYKCRYWAEALEVINESWRLCKLLYKEWRKPRYNWICKEHKPSEWLLLCSLVQSSR